MTRVYFSLCIQGTHLQGFTKGETSELQVVSRIYNSFGTPSGRVDDYRVIQELLVGHTMTVE